jgi:cation:H+ antiporter
MEVLWFLLLLLAITAGGWLLSHGAETMAEKYGANFAGSILLALVTTLPEYLFVYFAMAHDRPEVALGSAIGACTLLVTLGYGSVILFATSRFSRRPVDCIELSRHTRLDAVYLLLTAAVALALAWEGGGLDLKDALILAAVFGVYVAQHYRVAQARAARIEHSVSRRRAWQAAGLFLGGGAIILACAEPFVLSMVGLARQFGVSPMAIAIVLSPVASEMPEKMTAYLTVIRDGRLAEISVANFMGSKVNHNSLLLALMPVAAWLHGRGQVNGVVSVPFLVMTILTFFAGFNLMRRRLSRTAGWVFLGLYALIIFAALQTGTAPTSH